MSADFTYAALVADRTDIEGVLFAARLLDEPTPNNGWTTGAKLFEKLDHPYLFMIATDRSRCLNGAPLVHICQDRDTLSACALGLLSELEGRGQWMGLGSPETRSLVHELVQASAAKGECVLESERS
jgi:hypothetical protein